MFMGRIPRGTILAVVSLLALERLAYADEWVKFNAPDKRTASLIEKLFRAEFTRPSSEYELAPELADEAKASWVKLSAKEEPSLFVMLGGKYCGSGGCPIFGFGETERGWSKIYFQFGGEGVELLSTSTNGRRDIRQYEGMGAAESLEIISRWNKAAYVPAVTRQIR